MSTYIPTAGAEHVERSSSDVAGTPPSNLDKQTNRALTPITAVATDRNKGDRHFLTIVLMKL
jgi:hypothetical protein